jgi:hypothetical protein
MVRSRRSFIAGLVGASLSILPRSAPWRANIIRSRWVAAFMSI